MKGCGDFLDIHVRFWQYLGNIGIMPAVDIGISPCRHKYGIGPSLPETVYPNLFPGIQIRWNMLWGCYSKHHKIIWDYLRYGFTTSDFLIEKIVIRHNNKGSFRLADYYWNIWFLFHLHNLWIESGLILSEWVIDLVWRSENRKHWWHFWIFSTNEHERKRYEI